jgi:hypothetical protein
VRAFVDFLVERLSVDVDYMTALCSNGLCHEMPHGASHVDTSADAGRVEAPANSPAAASQVVEAA